MYNKHTLDHKKKCIFQADWGIDANGSTLIRDLKQYAIDPINILKYQIAKAMQEQNKALSVDFDDMKVVAVTYPINAVYVTLAARNTDEYEMPVVELKTQAKCFKNCHHSQSFYAEIRRNLYKSMLDAYHYDAFLNNRIAQPQCLKLTKGGK